MLRRTIQAQLGRMERKLGYDLGYVRYIVDSDVHAFLRLARIRGMTEYCRDVALEIRYAARIVGTLAEDCGPCTQLGVTKAEQDGVSPDVLRAILRGDDAALPSDVRLCVQFSRAVLARDPSADVLREAVLARWGRRGLVTIAFALTSARIFPTLKGALGYAASCARVEVAGSPVQLRPALSTASGASA